MFGQSEIPVLFLKLHDLSPFAAKLALLIPVLLGEILFLPDRVETPIGFFVQLSFVFELGEDLLDTVLMSFVGGCSPAVVVDPQLFPEADELFRIALGEGGDIDLFPVGGLLIKTKTFSKCFPCPSGPSNHYFILSYDDVI